MTNLVEINALCISSGGVGGHYTALSALNELCTLQGVTAGHFTNLSALNALAVGLGATGGYVTNLQALNAISVAIGGTGGYNTALAAWTEIVGIGLDSAYDPATDADLNLYYSSRSGNTLLETGSGSNRNAQIMPRVAKFAGTDWLNFGATYNPSPAVVTIYAAFKRTGGTGNGCVFSTVERSAPYTGLSLYIDTTTGKIGTYTNAFKYSTGTPATVGAWVKAMLRFTMGNSGKVEVLYDGGNWETLHNGFNFPTSIIVNNGTMSTGAWQGTGGTGQNFFTGSIAEVKIWESSKEWADRDSACDMHIPLAGNGVFEYAMNSTTKLAAQWAAPQYRFEYSEYGSKYWMDNGYEIWKKAVYATPVTQWVPKGCPQTGLLAGSWVQIKVYDGSATGFNFFDSYIDFDPTASAHADLDCWDRDNTTIFNDYARVNYTLAGYIHQYFTDKPYYWHSDEINRNSLKNYTKTGHTNRLFPKATDNSMGFNSRKLLVEILSMDNADSTKTAKVETYTGDKLLTAGVCFTHDDFGYLPARLTNMTAVMAAFFQRFFLRFTYFMDVPAQADLETNEAEIQALRDKGIEIGNHTKNHYSWKEYLLTHTDQEHYDNEIAPVSVYQDNVFGVPTVSFAYPRDMGFDAGVDALMVAGGFVAIRHTDYNGTDPAVNTMRFAHYTPGDGHGVPAWMTNNEVYADLEAEFAYAKSNGTVFTLCLHAVTTDNSGTNISYEWYEKFITYMLDNNMSIYTMKQLPELSF